MMNHAIHVLDVYPAAVRQTIQAAAPENFALRFAESYDPAEQQALFAEAECVLTGWAKITAEMVAAAPRLRMVQKWGIGIDRIDVDALRSAGIPLSITAGVNAGPVAEHAVMLMLAALRRVSQLDASLRRGEWIRSEMRSICLQLTGKTIGLIGLGNIGRMVARKVRGFEPRLVYYDVRRLPEETERELAIEYLPLETLLAESDVVSLHAPFTGENRHLIGEAALSLMKPTAVLVNTARGELVDEAALHRALSEGRLLAAGLDAFDPEPPAADNPLFALNNVVATPHTGGSVFDNVGNTARHALGNIARFLSGEALAAADVIIPVSQGRM